MSLDKPLKLDFLNLRSAEPLEARKDKRIQDQQSQLSYLQKRNQQLEEENQQLKATQAQLKKEQQRSSQLSTKLLAKVEADASELRERYAEKAKSEQELKDLIKELHAKLQSTSRFYHKIEQDHPEWLEKL